MGGRNSWRWLGEVIGVAAVFYLGARLGRTVAPPPGFTTVFWPPSEIAVAALLILGKRVWPGVLLGAMLSTNWSGTDLSNFSSVLMQAFIVILSVSAIAMAAGVAERNAATVALQTSERWLRECQRISHIGSYVFNTNDGSWTSSDTLDEIFGIGPDFPHTLEGWGALLHPDDRKEALRQMTSTELKTRQSGTRIPERPAQRR